MSTEVTAQRGDEELGRDVLTFQRMDGVAENFHTEQNRDLLEKLASQTGGRYWRPQDLSKLPGEIPYSEAGITDARNEGTVEHAGHFPADPAAALLRMAAAAEMGGRVKTSAAHRACAARVLCCSLRCPRARASYYVTVAGLGGEPDYEQRFTALAKDLDKLFKASGSEAHVYTLTGGDATRAHLTDTLGQVARRGQAGGRFRADPDRPRLVRRRRVQIQSGRAGHFRRRIWRRCATTFPPSAS